MFGCKHKWELLDKTVLPSAYEQMAAINPGFKTITKTKSTQDTISVFQKKAIIICVCKECGKLYQSVEVNPD